ncbi:MAG: triose-phosphate isomerase [Janthinobacterium lividum]
MSKIIVGNWKMNGTLSNAKELTTDLVALSQKNSTQATVVICPPYPYLSIAASALSKSTLKLGAQDCSSATNGAHTGQVSATMLKDLSCSYVILGHSERRTQMAETSKIIAEKIQRVLEAGLIPIVCVGESLTDRESGSAVDVVMSQAKAIFHPSCLLAYEPVWAIGSGKVPSGDQIEEMHQALAQSYPSTDILYGGSVKSSNATEILSIPNVGGLLVGGASLQADEFWAIAQASNDVF